MKKVFIVFFIALYIIPFSLQAQTKYTVAHKTSSVGGLGQAGIFNESSLHVSPNSLQEDGNFPSAPLSPLISVPGATTIGITGKWFTQGFRGLHNIQVDPDNPMRIHAVIMNATGVVAADTTTANFFPTRNCYYIYSADGGATWTTPKKLALTRSGYPDMILYKRGGNYVPIIADHHFTSASVVDLFCSVYVETGNPGDGNFKSADCDRSTFNGSTFDIIWPSIAVSNDGKTLYIIATVSTMLVAQIDHIQFGTFSLAADGTPSSWSGWQQGPTPNDLPGLATGGYYTMRTSTKGTIGILWQNDDVTTPDLGIYFSESKDGGKTWADATNVFASVLSTLAEPVDNPGAYYLRAGINEGLDFYYDQEVATAVFEGYFTQTNTGTGAVNDYFPSSGTLMYWRQGMTLPSILISRFSNFQDASSSLGPAINDGSFLSNDSAISVDPQEPNLVYPTIARTSAPGIWSIYFEAWVNNDSAMYNALASDHTTDTTVELPFHSIYRISTTDDGATWQDPVAVETNDMSQPASKHLDYRFPEVSSWNPIASSAVQNNILFSADTAAGNWFVGLDPGFDNVSWFFTKDQLTVNSVRDNSVSGSISVNQNYPNPFIVSTTIPLIMKNDDVVTLSVTDILGREVAIAYHGRLSPGEHQIPFNAPNLGAGIYTYTLKTSTGSVSRTMSLVK